MKIKLITVGSVKEEYYRKKIKEFQSKIKNLEIIELKDESIPKNASEKVLEDIKRIEGEKILDKLSPKDYIITLCIEGKPTTEQMLVKEIEKAKDKDASSIAFIIGGSLGLSQEVKDKSNYKLSFSKMTFPHQLMRVMLLEQIEKCV